MQAEYDDASVGAGWVVAYIGKIKIECHEDSTLISGSFEDGRIVLAS
jgi:hypothetical protein